MRKSSQSHKKDYQDVSLCTLREDLSHEASEGRIVIVAASWERSSLQNHFLFIVARGEWYEWVDSNPDSKADNRQWTLTPFKEP